MDVLLKEIQIENFSLPRVFLSFECIILLDPEYAQTLKWDIEDEKHINEHIEGISEAVKQKVGQWIKKHPKININKK